MTDPVTSVANTAFIKSQHNSIDHIQGVSTAYGDHTVGANVDGDPQWNQVTGRIFCSDQLQALPLVLVAWYQVRRRSSPNPT